MPSSTSAFERRQAAHAIVVLLSGAVLYLCGLEALTRIGYPRINHVARGIRADYRNATALEPVSEHQSSTLLIVGNSYLDLGVRRDALQQEIWPRYSVAYMPISGTGYVDWYFGLRRLFAEGSRPAVVGLCLSTRDVLSDSTMGEPFAHDLMRHSDVLNVKKQSRLDNNETSDFLFANLSTWLGHRRAIHNWLLAKSLPMASDLAKSLRPQNELMPPADAVVAKALPRLRAMKDLCNENGARFFLLIPPTRDVNDASNELRAAASAEKILVVLPFQHAGLPESDFLDGAHLDPQGAAIFTRRLGPTLLKVLDHRPRRPAVTVAAYEEPPR